MNDSCLEKHIIKRNKVVKYKSMTDDIIELYIYHPEVLSKAILGYSTGVETCSPCIYGYRYNNKLLC